jgi:hypothetical protein
MTTPIGPKQARRARAPRPDLRTVVLLTFDQMQDALARRDGDTFVNCLESLRHYLGDEAVDAMVAYFIQIGTRRLTARLNDRRHGGGT